MRHQNPPTRKFATWRWSVTGLIVIALLIAGLVAPFVLAAAPHGQDDAGEALRIGYLGPADSPTANGAQLAIDQINSVGGFTTQDGTVYRLELVALDEAPTIETLSAAINELVGQDVTVLLGPDDNTLFTAENIQALIDTRLPVLTGATIYQLTDQDTSNTLLRTRAPEDVYSASLAAYLTGDLGLSTIAMVQVGIEATEAVTLFEGALQGARVVPVESLRLPPGAVMVEPAQELLNLNPEAIVAWGPYEDITALLRRMRDGGWTGWFVYRHAHDAVQAGVMPADLAYGVLGTDSWSYAYGARTSRIFLHDYAVAFGDVPTALSVAAYDAIWFLRAVIIEEGAAPQPIRRGILNSPPRQLVQGTLHPADFKNGDLARVAVIYQLGPNGEPVVVARFDSAQRVDIQDDRATPTPVPTAIPPTATLGPPTETSEPTATLEGTWARVTAERLRVRTGPDTVYDEIGQVEQDQGFRVIGASADFTWLMIDFNGRAGWVSAEWVKIEGDLAEVEIVPAPPTPTAAATVAPTLSPTPDIVIDTVVLNPTQPIPNKLFTATVTVRNAGGGAAGQFAVAATFEPGSVYTAELVNGLAAGQIAQVNLTGTLTGTGPLFQVAVIADLNKEVAELDENNNTYQLSYRVDYPLFTDQRSIQVNAATDIDMFGGTVDFTWDGYNIGMRNGAAIGLLGSINYNDVHYDMLSAAVVNNTIGLDTNQSNTGVVAGVYTAEGKRAVLRIDNRQGTTIWISYRVYNDTP